MILEDGTALADDRPITDLEGLLGVRFPQVYKDLVRGQDGATSEYGLGVFSKDKGREIFVEVSALIPFVYDEKPGLTMDGFNGPGRTPHKPNGLVAFAQDGAGYLFCFDYRSSTEPSVVILTNDWVEEPVIPVAESFEAFRDMLVPYVES